jgi:peroxiredoxin
LADFQEHYTRFMEKGIRIKAASVDPEGKAEEMVREHSLGFTVGWGLDPFTVSSLTGAFYEEEKGFLHATGFVIDPEGRIVNAVYSTGPIGRLTAGDCLAKISFEMDRK